MCYPLQWVLKWGRFWVAGSYWDRHFHFVYIKFLLEVWVTCPTDIINWWQIPQLFFNFLDNFNIVPQLRQLVHSVQSSPCGTSGPFCANSVVPPVRQVIHFIQPQLSHLYDSWLRKCKLRAGEKILTHIIYFSGSLVKTLWCS